MSVRGCEFDHHQRKGKKQTDLSLANDVSGRVLD